MIYQSDTTIVFSYKLSSSFIEKTFVESGKMLALDQKLVINASTLTESERRFLVREGMPLKEIVNAHLTGFSCRFLTPNDISVKIVECLVWD